MKAPDKIYINGFSAFATEPVKDGTEHIRKEALLEWAKEQMRVHENRILDAAITNTSREGAAISGIKRDMYKVFIDKLNSM